MVWLIFETKSNVAARCTYYRSIVSKQQSQLIGRQEAEKQQERDFREDRAVAETTAA